MGINRRYLAQVVEEDAIASRKITLLSGPRQVGKTTLARSLLTASENYYSWDDPTFRRAWVRSPVGALAERRPGPIVLDEIHKERRWKSLLKGLYDATTGDPPLIVTGSARLDIYRKGSDSLLGRYLPYRLHPFSVAEAEQAPKPDEAVERIGHAAPCFGWKDLLALGGFPEPLLAGNEQKARRWSRLRIDRLIGEDVRDLRAVLDHQALRILTDLLPLQVGGLLSVNALREDVGKAYATVRDWVQVLEALYYCFLVRPYSERISRSIKAEPKIYLFDPLQLPKESEAARLENLAALHLLKATQYWTDIGEGEFDLRFIRTKEGREVDFLVVRDKKPWMLVECKSNSKTPAENLVRFARALKVPHCYQLVTAPGNDRIFADAKVRVLEYGKFFAGLV